MALTLDRPEVLTPPEHPPRCCTQTAITVPPEINAKTPQKHDYPGPAWRRSYHRRTGVERTFPPSKTPPPPTSTRGWCRLMGVTAITLFLTCAMVVRNPRVIAPSRLAAPQRPTASHQEAPRPTPTPAARRTRASPSRLAPTARPTRTQPPEGLPHRCGHTAGPPSSPDTLR